MNHHTITAHCDRCGATIALNPIQLVTHPLCIPAGHAWGTFVRAHMKCGNTETLQLAPLDQRQPSSQPNVTSATQPLLPGGPVSDLRVVGAKSGGQPIPMVTHHAQPIVSHAPQPMVTHPPSPSAAGPAGGQQGMVKQTATIFMPDGSSYDATQQPPAPSSTPAGTAAVQVVQPQNGHRVIGPYEWGPLEGAELEDPDTNGVFVLNIDSTLMIERTTPPVIEATTNGQPLQVGPDSQRYTLQFMPGRATLTARDARRLSVVGRRLLKYNGQPWIDPVPPTPTTKPAPMPSTLLKSSTPTPAAEPTEEPEHDEATEPELNVRAELEAPPASVVAPTADPPPAEAMP
jgi:hypothetical protein